MSKEREMSRKEVQAELAKLGIDIGPAWEKVRIALHESHSKPLKPNEPTISPARKE